MPAWSGLSVVAVDGSKVAANASREVNVDYERLAREVIERARQLVFEIFSFEPDGTQCDGSSPA
jgi:hypothetical protein